MVLARTRNRMSQNFLKHLTGIFCRRHWSSRTFALFKTCFLSFASPASSKLFFFSYLSHSQFVVNHQSSSVISEIVEARQPPWCFSVHDCVSALALTPVHSSSLLPRPISFTIFVKAAQKSRTVPPPTLLFSRRYEPWTLSSLVKSFLQFLFLIFILYFSCFSEWQAKFL